MSKFSRLSVYAASAVCLTLSACAFSKNEGPTDDQKTIKSLNAQLEANRPLVAEDFKHEFISGAQLNDYTARISWPANRPLTIKLIQNDRVLKTINGLEQNTHELKCDDGYLTYSAEVISAAAGRVSEPKIKIPCPFDYTVVQGISNLEVLKQVTGKLQLQHGSTIALSSQDLELNVRELEIDGIANIITMNSNRTADRDDAYRKPSPTIRIHAKKAKGVLVLQLNGVDGHTAPDGVLVPDPSLDGAPGAPGQAEEVCGEGRVTKNGETIPGKCRMKCTVQPQNGADGRRPMVKVDDKFVPKKGGKGSNGIPGVGTSKVDLQILDSSAFRVEIAFNPGLASEPGRGDFPKGGVGGAPGANPHGVCTPANQGKPDMEGGIRGDAGNTAPNGRCETVYVSASLIDKVTKTDLNSKLPCTPILGIVQVGTLPRE